jgi:hypothetical protein
MGLCTGKHYSKPKPEFFQRKVLETLEKKLKEMDQKQKNSEYRMLNVEVEGGKK